MWLIISYCILSGRQLFSVYIATQVLQIYGPVRKNALCSGKFLMIFFYVFLRLIISYCVFSGTALFSLPIMLPAAFQRTLTCVVVCLMGCKWGWRWRWGPGDLTSPIFLTAIFRTFLLVSPLFRSSYTSPISPRGKVICVTFVLNICSCVPLLLTYI